MELTIKDRLYIPTFLPKEGTFKEFNLKKEIIRKVEITTQEREEINLHENTETKRIEWDNEKETPIHIEFSADEMNYLKTVCEKLSDESLNDDVWATVEVLYNSHNNEISVEE